MSDEQQAQWARLAERADRRNRALIYALGAVALANLLTAVMHFVRMAECGP